MSATARTLAGLPADARAAVLASLTAPELESLEYQWAFWARQDQLPPQGVEWRTFLMLGGRGSGKTRSAAEWVRGELEAGRRRQIGIIAPTADTLRRICVEGPSGLMTSPPWNRPSFEPSTRRVVYPGGGVVHLFSAEEPDRLRGPNLDGLWIDELTSMSNAAECWDVAMMALRIPGPMGAPPVCIVTTTPKPSPLLRAIIASPTTVVTRAKTVDNAANLDASTLAYLHDKYGGTRLGRQEMDAELLDDAEGALWTRKLLDDCRIERGGAPKQFQRIVVAVDPPGGSSRTNAECGIVVGAIGLDQHGYVLADLSDRMTPEQWARAVVNAYHGYQANRIVAEQNFGGAMVESTIRTVEPNVPIRMVVASRGKQLRAEPIAALYEQHRVHHVGEFPQLEDQMTGWDPAESGPSPDRVDALVWALTDLMTQHNRASQLPLTTFFRQFGELGG
jgi:phage terminase large subunit-like protein